MPETIPDPLRDAGIRRSRELDVRPILARGEDPFHVIRQAVDGLGEGEAVELIVHFEPRPLYTVLGARGFAHHSEERDGVWHVFFYPAPAGWTPPATATEGGETCGGGCPGTTHPPLQDPVEMDVRGLEPPEPMMRILEKLAELGPGAQLIVRHHREPVLLYDKLHERGYRAVTTKRGEGDYVVHILPEYAPGAQG